MLLLLYLYLQQSLSKRPVILEKHPIYLQCFLWPSVKGSECWIETRCLGTGLPSIVHPKHGVQIRMLSAWVTWESLQWVPGLFFVSLCAAKGLVFVACDDTVSEKSSGQSIPSLNVNLSALSPSFFIDFLSLHLVTVHGVMTLMTVRGTLYPFVCRITFFLAQFISHLHSFDGHLICSFLENFCHLQNIFFHTMNICSWLVQSQLLLHITMYQQWY